MAARIPATEITGLYGVLVRKFSKRMFGSVPDSLGVMWHNVPVLKTTMGFGQKLQKWDQCEESLKTYAHMAVASYIGCTWCLDFNYFMAKDKGLDLDKAREIPRWREAEVFSPLEREVLEYAEAMSTTPVAVTDEMVAGLLRQLAGSPHITERATNRIADQIRPAPGCSEIEHGLTRQPSALLFADGAEAADLRTEPLCQQRIATQRGRDVPRIQHQRVEADLRRCSSRQATLIGSEPASNDKHIAAPFLCLAEPELEAPDLVAAESQRHAIIALHPELRMPDRLANAPHRLEHGRATNEVDPRKRAQHVACLPTAPLEAAARRVAGRHGYSCESSAVGVIGGKPCAVEYIVWGKRSAAGTFAGSLTLHSSPANHGSCRLASCRRQGGIARKRAA